MPWLKIIFLVIYIPFIVFFWKRSRNFFIDKKEVWNVLRRYRIVSVIIALLWSFHLVWLRYRIIPAYQNVYNAFDYPAEILLQVSSYLALPIIVIIIIIALYFYFSKSIEEEFKNILAQYHDEEKIDIRTLFSKKIYVLVYSIIFLPLVPSILSLVSFFLFYRTFIDVVL